MRERMKRTAFAWYPCIYATKAGPRGAVSSLGRRAAVSRVVSRADRRRGRVVPRRRCVDGVAPAGRARRGRRRVAVRSRSRRRPGDQGGRGPAPRRRGDGARDAALRQRGGGARARGLRPRAHHLSRRRRRGAPRPALARALRAAPRPSHRRRARGGGPRSGAPRGRHRAPRRPPNGRRSRRDTPPHGALGRRRVAGGAVRSFADVPWIGWGERLAHLPAARWLECHVGKDAPVVRSDSLRVQLATVAAGVGVALVPEPSVAWFGLVPLELAAKLRAAADEWPQDELFLVTHRALRDVPRVRAVWELIRERHAVLSDPRSAPPGARGSSSRPRRRPRST
jgi:LysR substrate binding domain